MAAPNATAWGVYAQAFDFSSCVIDITTGNPITGGLTGLAVTISKDNGAFAALGGTFSEIGTSGYVAVFPSIADMTCNKAIVQVSATNTNARFDRIEIKPLDLLGTYVKRYDLIPGVPLKFEQMLKNIHTYIWDENDLNGAQQTVKNDNGVVMGTGVSIRGNASSNKGKIS